MVRRFETLSERDVLSVEFGTACKDLQKNQCPSTIPRAKTDGIAERVVRRAKDNTSAILFQFGLDER